MPGQLARKNSPGARATAFANRFRDEKAAYEGVYALSETNAEGSVDVAQVCVIKKESDGRFSTKEVTDDFPIRTLAGSALGAAVGVLAGPVHGELQFCRSGRWFSQTCEAARARSSSQAWGSGSSSWLICS